MGKAQNKKKRNSPFGTVPIRAGTGTLIEVFNPQHAPEAIPANPCLCSDCNTHIDCAAIAARSLTYEDYKKAVLEKRKFSFDPIEPIFTDRVMGFLDGERGLALAFRNMGISLPGTGDIERESKCADRIILDWYSTHELRESVHFRVKFEFAQYDMGAAVGVETYFRDTIINKSILENIPDPHKRLENLKQRIAFYNYSHSL